MTARRLDGTARQPLQALKSADLAGKCGRPAMPGGLLLVPLAALKQRSLFRAVVGKASYPGIRNDVGASHE